MVKSAFNSQHLFHTTLLLAVVIFSSSFSTTAQARRSPEEVFKYQKHMAQAGYASAIYKLAVMYQNGYGTPRDLKQALELYKEAAAKGYENATPRISELEIMIESGDFSSTQTNAKQQELEQEQARLKAEKERLREEREALNKAQREATAARIEEQRLKQQAANSQRQADQQRLIDERRKLNEEMAKLREEKLRLSRENQELERARQKSAADEMRALEEATIMLMDSTGRSAEEQRTIDLMSK
jgi:septal ring factor EnvC (AmiA/AmiB activator)